MEQDTFQHPIWRELMLMAEEQYFRVVQEMISNDRPDFTLMTYAYLRGKKDQILEFLMLEEQYLKDKKEKEQFRAGLWERIKGTFRRTIR